MKTRRRRRWHHQLLHRRSLHRCRWDESVDTFISTTPLLVLGAPLASKSHLLSFATALHHPLTWPRS